MELQRLDHVSLNVVDRARSIAWYRDVLGLPQLNQPTADDEPVFLGQPGLQFGLFQAERDSPAREAESSGLRHVALVVDDLDGARNASARTESSSGTRITGTRCRCTSTTQTGTSSS